MTHQLSLYKVLAGDIDEAICTHALYYTLWRRYEALPERFDWKTQTPSILFYPLRPELVESTYLLYQVSKKSQSSQRYTVCLFHKATHNPFYLHVGSDILNSLEKHAKARYCGSCDCHVTALYVGVDMLQYMM